MNRKFKPHAEAIAEMLMLQLEAQQPCGEQSLWSFVKLQTVLRDFNDNSLVEVTREKFDQVLSILVEKGLVEGNDDDGYYAVYYEVETRGPDGYYRWDRITAYQEHMNNVYASSYQLFSEFRN